MQSQKQQLRKLAKQKLLQLIGTEDHHHKNTLLSKNLGIFLKGRNAILEQKVVGAFAPLKDEPYWACELACGKINFAFPALSEGQEMTFYPSAFKDLVETEEFGVKLKAPIERNKDAVIPDIMLIPGLAFTANGERLGRGKGFFDRYLKNYLGLKIGICFEEQIFTMLPIERHDQLMDFVVTDGAIYRR